MNIVENTVSTANQQRLIVRGGAEACNAFSFLVWRLVLCDPCVISMMQAGWQQQKSDTQNIRNNVYFLILDWLNEYKKKHLEVGGHKKYLQMQYLQAGIGITGGLLTLTGQKRERLRQSWGEVLKLDTRAVRLIFCCRCPKLLIPPERSRQSVEFWLHVETALLTLNLRAGGE